MSKKRKAKNGDKPADRDADKKSRGKDYDKHLRKLQVELLELQRQILAVNERLLHLANGRAPASEKAGRVHTG